MAWSSTAVMTIVLAIAFGACSGGSSDSAENVKPKPREDFVAQATDFRNLHTMTKVRGFFIDNRLGHLDDALAVANSPDGGEYPVGTIIQLVPQEAMVKRHKGFSPATRDWEFFFLSVSTTGTEIQSRGTDQVVNRFGGNCASCHQAAEARFDGVCEKNHGCALLPIGDDVFHALQESDPRPLG
jgi:hypothetical protein